jgi:hypothetical protein
MAELTAMNRDSFTPSARALAPWKTIAVFALVGPLIGSILGMVMFAAVSGKVASLADAGSMALVMLPFGYVFGLVPAALTGVAVAWARANFSQASTAQLGAIWGALWASVGGLAVAWMADGGGIGFALTIAWFAVMGTTAGYLCGRLSRGAPPDQA